MSAYMVIDYDSLLDLSIPQDSLVGDSIGLRQQILGRFPLATTLSQQLLELLFHNMKGRESSQLMYTISDNAQALNDSENTTDSIQKLQNLILRTVQIEEGLLPPTVQRDIEDVSSDSLSPTTPNFLTLGLEPISIQWPPLPQTSLVPIPQSGSVQRWWYFQYGDCGESLPLAVMTKNPRLGGNTVVHSIAAFVDEFKVIESIPEDGQLEVAIELKGPCLNCRSLMKQLPESITILGASGSSHKIYWEDMGHQTVYGAEIKPLDSSFQSHFQAPNKSSGSSRFSLSAAYSATENEIYAILAAHIFPTGSSILSVDLRKNLARLWYEFIIPYRDKGAIFHLDGDDNTQAIVLTVNGVAIPICTVFCALSYILSTVLRADRVAAQQELSYLPLMAVLAKWCYTLCPWGHPNVVSVLYITSQEPDVDTIFLLGTSRPSMQVDSDQPKSIGVKHSRQMRSIRKDLLGSRFGLLQFPCPEKIAAETRYLPS